MTSLPAIEIDSLSKNYGLLQALKNISLRVEQGEFFGLLGPNGAGKTTLISLLAGLVRPSSGSLKILGYDVIADYRKARMQLGVVPQELVFDPFFSVRELLRIQSGYFGLSSNDDWIDEILTHLDLIHKADSNIRILSGGMKRRVLVAQALVHRPPVIVLDEPTAGVDVELRQGLWQFIRQLNDQGHTIILTTHYLEEAQAMCERIAMLKGGQIVALDNTQALLHKFMRHDMHVRLSDPAIGIALGGQYDDRSDWVMFRFEHYSDIEKTLAQLRTAGAELLEIQIGNTDLEHVFVEIMHNA